MSEIWPMVPKIALKCKTVNQTVIKYLVNNAWGTLAECRWLEVRSCEGPKDQKGPKPRSQGPEDFPYEMKLCGWSVEMGQLMVPACRHHPLLMVFPSTIQRQNNVLLLWAISETFKPVGWKNYHHLDRSQSLLNFLPQESHRQVGLSTTTHSWWPSLLQSTNQQRQKVDHVTQKFLCSVLVWKPPCWTFGWKKHQPVETKQYPPPTVKP